jgi:hypothetical protein
MINKFCGELTKKLVCAGLMALPMMTLAATSALAQDSFGAIARSRSTGDKGYSWDYGSRAQAERRAINECNNYSGAGDCRALLWFKNACGSIAEASNGGAGTGWGSNASLAESYALESCSSVGRGCEVTRTICTGN